MDPEDDDLYYYGNHSSKFKPDFLLENTNYTLHQCHTQNLHLC